MKHTFKEKAAELVRSNRVHKRWMRVLSGMMAAVVFVTTYMLILPAITLADDTGCGLVEHTHTEACYELRLVCTAAADEGHTHTEACYPSPETVCGQEESPGHSHTEACYTVSQELTCGQSESAGHSHGDGCIDSEGNLVCGETESDGHAHSEACYTETRTLTCTEGESAGHTHTDACRGEAPAEPTCGQEERPPAENSHVHDESCYERVLVCGLEEHVHTDECRAVPEQEIPEPEEITLINGFPETLPEGYVSYEYEDESGLSVLAYAPEDAFGGTEVALLAELLAEDSDEYAAAGTNLDAEGVERDGFVAIDIRFVDAAEEEIEPDAEHGRVYVRLTGAALIPEEADAGSVAVQHHKAENDALLGFIPAGERILVEVVADGSSNTGDVTLTPGENGQALDVIAAFPVESFSIFTLTWSGGNGLLIQCIDTAGAAIGGGYSGNITGTAAVTSVAPQISAHMFSKAVVATSPESAILATATQIARLRRDSGNWQYNTAANGNGSGWTNVGGSTVYFIYTVTPSTIQTVNSRADGITINVFNYNGTDINSGKSLKFIGSGAENVGTRSWSTTPWNIWTETPGGVYQGIVRNTLESGYPRLRVSGQDSLSYLFSTSSASGKTVYADANYLFQKDADGYYHYNSATNFAKLSTTSRDFTVYSQPINNGTGLGDPKFLPFNDITDRSNYDLHFGMTVATEFLMPKNGKVGANNMVFEFEGDDDVWIFIDGALVLDMGGIHDNYSGSINFATGAVHISNVNTGSLRQSAPYDTTLYALMTAAKGSAWVTSNMVEKNGNWVFRDYTIHDLDFFYLERGSGGSNCKLSFNLPTIPRNSLLIGKSLDVMENQAGADLQTYLNNLTFNFRVLKAGASPDTTSASDLFLGASATYTLMDSATSQQIGGTHTVGADGIITLKPGQLAVLANAYDATSSEYYVQELVGANFTGQYGSIQYTVGAEGGTAVVTENNVVIGSIPFTGYSSGLLNPANDQNTVTFTNRVDVDELSLLKVTKEVLPGSLMDDDTGYDMKVRIGGELLPVGTAYQLTDAQGIITMETVTAEGVITLKAGETAGLTILAGTTYHVEEQNASSYTVIYQKTAKDGYGNPIANPSGDSQSGTVDQVHSTIHITVKNADYDFAASLPLQKTLQNADAAARSFTFQITEMTLSGDVYTEKTEGRSFQRTLAGLSSASPSHSGLVYFGFKSTAETGDYYFKISEIVPADTGGVSYDTNYYIVTVTVSAGGVKTASVTAVAKYDKNGGAVDFNWTDEEDPAAFTNAMTGTLALTKQVIRTDGSGMNAEAEYVFELSIPAEHAGGYAVAYENEDENGPTHTSGTLTFTATDGAAVAVLTLYHNETATISGLPASVSAVITETGTDGYAVSWSGSGLYGGQSAASVTTKPMSENPHVICTNSTGVLLPHTGGIGTGAVLLPGAVFTLGAGGLLLVMRRRRKGENGSA